MAIDRFALAKYYAERSQKGNIVLPMSCSNGKFVRLIWPTLGTTPALVSPNSVKAFESFVLAVGQLKTLYALGASPATKWKAIFQEPVRPSEEDPEFVLEVSAGVAEAISEGDSIIVTAKRNGRAQIYFYDKYKKSYYGAYALVDFRVLPAGPHKLYVSAANGSPQSITLSCYGYPGALETWNITDYRICTASLPYTTIDTLFGTGTIIGKNSSITFTAAYSGTTTISYKDTNWRNASNSVIITVVDGDSPPPLHP